MAKYRKFEELPVWQDAARLYNQVLDLLEQRSVPLSPAFRNQLERATLSVSNNIAEGFERVTTAELLGFLAIARGSAGEVRSMVSVVQARPRLKPFWRHLHEIRELTEACARQITAWTKSIESSNVQGKRHLAPAARQQNRLCWRQKIFVQHFCAILSRTTLCSILMRPELPGANPKKLDSAIDNRLRPTSHRGPLLSEFRASDLEPGASSRTNQFRYRYNSFLSKLDVKDTFRFRIAPGVGWLANSPRDMGSHLECSSTTSDGALMKILFPCHPLKRRAVDPDFDEEANAADEAGFGLALYNLDVLRNNDVDSALTGLEVFAPSHELILHRGWMMSDSLYAQLHKGLRARGYAPVTSPEQYAEAHYFPNAYKHIADFTPESRWMLGRDSDEAWGIYSYFSDGPAIVKDFVKSAKHRWAEACFIPAHTPREKLEAILKTLLEDRGNQFNKGILFRRFHPLVQLETDLRGQPVYEEYRLFFFYGELVAATPAIHGQGPFGEVGKWTSLAKRFQNPFISMDIARQQDGSWIIIEVGDGGVSGLPLSIDSKLFYKALCQRIQEVGAS